jgi:hypothetical protein
MKKKSDVSLLRNEELRPWTVNTNLDGRLRMEKDALERTITYIAPNMSAGKLGSSILDGDIPGAVEFRTTLMKKTSSTPFVTKLAPMTEFFPLYVAKSNLNARLASTKQVSRQSSRQVSKPPSSNNSGARFYLTDNNYATSQNQTSDLNSTWPNSYETKSQFPSEESMFGLESLVEEDDIKKIDTLQRAICRQEKLRRSRASTSIRSVRLGRSISPATISMRYTEYQRLRNEMEKSSSGKQF